MSIFFNKTNIKPLHLKERVGLLEKYVEVLQNQVICLKNKHEWVAVETYYQKNVNYTLCYGFPKPTGAELRCKHCNIKKETEK